MNCITLIPTMTENEIKSIQSRIYSIYDQLEECNYGINCLFCADLENELEMLLEQYHQRYM